MEKLLIYLLALKFVLPKEPKKCFQFKCDESLSKNKICTKYLDENSTIALYQCEHNNYCKIDNLDKDNNLCVAAQYEYNQKLYPGSICSLDSDCLSRKCEKTCVGDVCNNICAGKEGGAACSDTSECNQGFFCEETCKKAKNKNEDCTSDQECKYPLGCFFSESEDKGKCTSFFSIENNTKISSSKANQFFCECGSIHNNKCINVKRTDEKCDFDTNDCFYTEPNGESFRDPDKCQCFYGQEVASKCKGGELDDVDKFNSLISLLKKTLDENNTSTCHQSEKRLSYCRSFLHDNWDARRENINLNRALIEYEYLGLYDSSMPCIIRTVLGYDETPPKPKDGNFKCPVYKCTDNDKFDKSTCAFGENPFRKDGDNITVLFPEDLACPKGKKCDYDKSLVYQNWTYNATCKQIESKKKWHKKYPGEECISHDQCYKGNEKEIGFCIDGICSGKDSGENCTDHGDCKVGYFCNGLVCERQKAEKNFCLESYECLNHLGCLNNTCVRYYSLSNGTYLNETNPIKELCKMGVINKSTNQCAERRFAKDEDNEKKFVECVPGDECNYTTGYYLNGKIVIETEKCECGFSKDGKSYCPIPQNINPKDWKNYFSYKNKLMDNNCHTLRRDMCYDEVSEKDYEKLMYYEMKTIRAHLFYGAEDCVKKALSQRMLTINSILLVVVLISFL